MQVDVLETTLTKLHKVVVLQDILCLVLGVQELSTSTPQHAELQLPVCILQLLGMMVASQGLEPQQLDRSWGAPTGNPEPLAPNTHRHTAHPAEKKDWTSQAMRLQHWYLGVRRGGSVLPLLTPRGFAWMQNIHSQQSFFDSLTAAIENADDVLKMSMPVYMCVFDCWCLAKPYHDDRSR